MGYEIRNFRAADLKRLQEITVEAFEPVSIDRNMETVFGAVGDRDWRWRKAQAIQFDCDRDPDGVFVAESNGEVVGYISTWIDREAGIGFIPNLALNHDQRGQGIGRALIEHALNHFRQQGATHARIETLDQNAVGQRLYPSLGFQEIARQIHYAMKLTEEDGEGR